ncbi:dTDP-4-dehydrorhamnose reductase [Paenibacillus sp. VCA1]|uniref:dTDP-4-dehydrorhamnose reductase n=1 Tax=Paenibacillus sp. VCA1 TaxID=3039148 RepID=UPI002872611D|nr:dTDP-4-dehydrorhamnose reductase [Paenibacillus sp. VCA1]MDR9853306.1 dTDP-4-dehydrorhamnose reductase [Paenibacillus sp. VCA1]
MKILVAGSEGQLGRLVVEELMSENEVVGLNSRQLDITNRDHIQKVVHELRPEIIINCAAYNDVDNAEKYPDLAMMVNEIGPRNIAEISNEYGITMVHISTDFVFDGNTRVPYHETSPTNPINVYGRTKLNGERFVQLICERYIILRTSWLYGSSKKNFFNSIVNLARTHKQINVVNDQVGNPTYLPDLVSHIRILLKKQLFGLFHCSGNGYCSKYDFAKSILKQLGIQTKVNSISSQEFNSLAKRPGFSALSNHFLESNVEARMPNWEESLEKYVKRIKG